MTITQFRQLILQGIEGLPPEGLQEVLDFVFFLRTRLKENGAIFALILKEDSGNLSRQSEEHLLEEWDEFLGATDDAPR